MYEQTKENTYAVYRVKYNYIQDAEKKVSLDN